MAQSTRDALFISADSRANFKNVIAKRSDLTVFDGGRMAKPSSGSVLHYAGEVLGLASSGADSGRYKPYNDAATDGSQTAVGVLSETVEVSAAVDESEIVVIKKGILLKDLLIGLDAAAIVDLGARSSSEHGVNLLSF